MKKKKLGYKIAGIIIVIFISTIFAVYYYFLHTGFTPNGEELTPIVRVHFGGRADSNVTALWNIVQEISYKIGGLSYVSLRISHSIMYFLIVSSGLVLALSGKDGQKRNWYILTVYCFFMVVVHLGGSQYFGQFEEDFHQYPLDNHVLPTIFVLWTLLCIQKVRNTEGKSKWFWAALGSVFTVIGIFRTDILFCIMLVGPIFTILIIELIKKRGNVIKQIGCGFAIAISGIFIFRILYFFIPQLDGMFNPKPVILYGEGLYGNANYIDISEIGQNIWNFIGALSGIFNIDFSNKPIICIYTVMYAFRAMLLVCIVIFCIKIMKKWWKSESRTENDYIDIILCVGLIYLSLAFLFTSNHMVRYIVGMLPYATILLCRNFNIINGWLKLDERKFKLTTFILLGMCCFIYATPPGEMDKNPDVWDDEYAEVLQIIDENHLGTGVGSIWIGPVLTCLSYGEEMVYGVDTNRGTENMQLIIKEIEEKGDACNFIIQGDGWRYSLLAYKDIVRLYGAPIETYTTGHFTIYQFDYDISQKFRKRQ